MFCSIAPCVPRLSPKSVLQPSRYHALTNRAINVETLTKIVRSEVSHSLTPGETNFHAACHSFLTSNPRAKCPAPDCGLPIAGMQMRIVGEGSVAKARDGDIGMFRKKRAGRRAGLGDEDGDDDEDELEEEVGVEMEYG